MLAFGGAPVAVNAGFIFHSTFAGTRSDSLTEIDSSDKSIKETLLKYNMSPTTYGRVLSLRFAPTLGGTVYWVVLLKLAGN